MKFLGQTGTEERTEKNIELIDVALEMWTPIDASTYTYYTKHIHLDVVRTHEQPDTLKTPCYIRTYGSKPHRKRRHRENQR